MNSRIAPTVHSSPFPFVVLGDDWGRHVSTTQHIFRRIARTHPVVWLNAINHRTPKLSVYDARRAAQKFGEMVRRKGSASAPAQDASAYLPGGKPDAILPPRILPWHNNPLVRRFNTHSVLRDLRAAIAHLGNHSRPVLLSATPAVPDVVRRLDAAVKIYFCIDDYAELQGVDKDLVLPLECETLSAVDAVVATAKSLVTTKRAGTGRGFYLPQGVNYEHFARVRSVPRDIASIPRPRIGFSGNLASVCDLDLLRGIAECHPDWSLVLVGPVSVDTSVLETPNIHLLGARPYAELPAYVQSFDVGIIPYLLTDWTRSVDPLKTLEYLAAGIPVVSLRLPEVEKYSPPVAIANDATEFRAALERTLRAPAESAEDRRSLAREHTWERRADQLLGIVQQISRDCP